MGISQFKRNFSVYFSNTVKSTFRYNRAFEKEGKGDGNRVGDLFFVFMKRS